MKDYKFSTKIDLNSKIWNWEFENQKEILSFVFESGKVSSNSRLCFLKAKISISNSQIEIKIRLPNSISILYI